MTDVVRSLENQATILVDHGRFSFGFILEREVVPHDVRLVLSSVHREVITTTLEGEVEQTHWPALVALSAPDDLALVEDSPWVLILQHVLYGCEHVES